MHLAARTGVDLDKRSRALDRLLERIRRSLRSKPHTLVAYAWVMYMALFSGGRIIRRVLLRADSDFWLDDKEVAWGDASASEKGLEFSTACPGFSFLCFDDGHDGTNIKAEFKFRLAKAEGLLSLGERADIIAAANGLFADCVGLVRLLDKDAGAQILRSRLSNAARPAAAFLIVVCLVWMGLRCRRK